MTGSFGICFRVIESFTISDCRTRIERYRRGGMDSRDLKPEQVERLRIALSRQLSYLNRLCARMQRLNFPIDDPVSRATFRARDALQDLYTRALYAGVKSGVGERMKDKR